MLDFFINKNKIIPDRKVPTKLIVDTDMGADDAQALFVLKKILEKNPDTELLGISCSWGNTAL
jgi:inosine-uridine nucleoside N-ribohydrolase